MDSFAYNRHCMKCQGKRQNKPDFVRHNKPSPPRAVFLYPQAELNLFNLEQVISSLRSQATSRHT
jgi:hypothetical protein